MLQQNSQKLGGLLRQKDKEHHVINNNSRSTHSQPTPPAIAVNHDEEVCTVHHSNYSSMHVIMVLHSFQ